MFIQLPDKLKKVRKTIYHPGAGVSVELREENEASEQQMREMERLAAQSELTFYTALKQLDQSLQAVEAMLVNKISVAVMMSLPEMNSEQMEHALFIKHIYHAGEVSFADYMQKMTNLFPDRVDNLSDDLKAQISERIEHFVYS